MNLCLGKTVRPTCSLLAALIAFAYCLPIFHPTCTAASGVFALGSEKHLFLDEFLIDRKENAQLVVNPPQRKELVLVADRPWERNGITSYGNVFWSEEYQEYRMYYVPVNWDSDPPFYTCLATSTDGVHWRKPNYGAVEWQGDRKNNIVINGQREGTVMVDPNAPPGKRYAFISSHPSLKTRLFTSRDGIHFKLYEKEISSHHSDSQVSSFWDDQLGKYVHYFRVSEGEPGSFGRNPKILIGPGVSYPQPERLGRSVARIETSRMDQGWDAPFLLVMARDEIDPKDADIYTNAATKYNLAKNAYLAFPTLYYHYSYPERKYLNEPALRLGGKSNDGTIETQLATSRDGKTWTRYRTPYVPLHMHEDLTLKIVMVYPGLVYRDGWIDQYFAGYTFTHGDTNARERLSGRELGGVFRLEQRVDGFISMDFDYGGGEVLTSPFTFSGKVLKLNVNTSASGELRVAILDATGKGIPRFGLAQARIVNGDYLDKIVEWGDGRRNVSDLAGKPIRLRFVARGTKLYSFWFDAD